MAHDVVSPLLAASLGWDLVLRLHPDEPRLQQIADVSRSAIKQSQRLVNDLLSFAMAGARPAPGETAELRPVLESVLESLRAEAEAAHVRLDAQVPEVSDIACASGVLTSVLSNLVRNAIRHMGGSASRVVSVRAEVSPKSVRCEVADSGHGIPVELQRTIFEPYVRGPTRASGIGLGLATVRRLVDSHGGRVGVRSSLGNGATFWFELPRAGAGRRLELLSGR
jgi:signal transduction histidine kinase